VRSFIVRSFTVRSFTLRSFTVRSFTLRSFTICYLRRDNISADQKTNRDTKGTSRNLRLIVRIV
jgi:hypothetical protein